MYDFSRSAQARRVVIGEPANAADDDGSIAVDVGFGWSLEAIYAPSGMVRDCLFVFGSPLGLFVLYLCSLRLTAFHSLSLFSQPRVVKGGNGQLFI